jgi:hypothetical protein
MGSVIFLSRKLVEAATITASSEQTTLPATNLIGPTPSKVWRSSGLSGVYVTVDFGAATAVDMVAMVAPNWTSAATWRIYGATSQANLGVSGYDSTSLSPWPVTGKPTEDWNQHAPFKQLGSTQTYRWWRIAITDAANTDGYLEAGALLIGAAVTITYNSIKDWTLGDEPADVVRDTDYGRMLAEGRDNPRVKSIPFSVLPTADIYGAYGVMMRERGTAKPFLACVDPAQTTALHLYTIYGLRRGAWSAGNIAYGLFSTGLKIKEHL